MTSIKLGLLFEGDILPSVNKYILFLHLLAAERENSSNINFLIKLSIFLCCYESYLSKSFIPLWFYHSSNILRRSWNFPNRVHIWHSPALHFLQKDIKTNPEPDISLQVFHIQSVNFLRQQWLQHCKWPHSHVLTADKIQAVKWKNCLNMASAAICC